MADDWSNLEAGDIAAGSMIQPTLLRRWLALFALVLFSGSASFGQVAVDVELIPDKPGPYVGGERVVLDVWIRGHATEDLGLPVVQLDFSASDQPIMFDPAFVFDFSAAPDGGSGYETFSDPALPVPLAWNTFGCFCPGFLLQLPANGSIHFGSITLRLPALAGVYSVDALNRAVQSSIVDRHGSEIRFESNDPGGTFGVWTALNGQIAGGSVDLVVNVSIPAASTWGLIVFALGLVGAAAVMVRRRELAE